MEPNENAAVAEELPQTQAVEETGLVPVSPEAIPETPSEAEIFPAGDELCVVARYPYQMQRCQAALVTWAEQKVANEQTAADDLATAVQHARDHKWATGAMSRAHTAAVKRVEFYTKIKLALEAGYCIVPNFPVDMFAVRTKRRKPNRHDSKWRGDVTRQTAQTLPAGEGEYQNPTALVSSRVVDRDEKNNAIVRYFASGWDQLEFPFTTAKPQILEATQRAMADKFFDEIGVLPGKAKKQDPIVVGRIIDPRSTTYNQVRVTFLIAWWIDTRVL